MPLGGARPRTSSYFRDLFGLAPAACLVLYSGSLGAWGKQLELVQSVRHWPENSTLIMHCGYGGGFESSYGKSLRTAAHGLPVYFSDRNLDYDALGEAMTSADIGVAHYEAIDANFTEILFSSNKIGEYLCSGLPVICSSQPGLKEFIHSNGVGCALPVEQTPQALQMIQSDLATYREAVHRCVQEHFDFSAWFEQALGDIFPDGGAA
jgi:hypothetical protein